MAVNKQVAIEIDDQDIQRPWDESPSTVDWSAFPEGYGILLNERYQFPLDLALWRMKIDRTRQLFIDDHMVAHKDGIVRETHSTKDHPANPLFDDKSHAMSWHIAPDPEHGWRLYYNSKGGLLHVAYSQDGLNWTKPELNVFDLSTVDSERFPGGANDVVCEGQLHGLFEEPDDPDPNRRFKAIITWPRESKSMSWPYIESAKGYRQYQLITSPDGYRWSFCARTNLTRGQPTAYRAPYQLPIACGDVLRVRWDPKLKVYVANTKNTVGPDMRFTSIFHATRTISQCESDDLIHFSAPRVYAYPDAEDAKIPGMFGIYEADGYPYESMWLNNFSMTVYNPASKDIRIAKNLEKNRPYLKRNWIRQAASRDGRHWYYFGDRKPFIPLGPEGSWKPHYMRILNLITTGGPVVKDDELWYYYFCGNIDGPKTFWKYDLGLATIRRDGFASLNADADAGTVITRPMVFEGDGKLHINAEVAKDGYVQVSVMEEQGEPIEGFKQEDCPAICQNATKVPVGWRSNETLAKLKDRYVRLVFHLKNAKLYSFWIE